MKTPTTKQLWQKLSGLKQTPSRPGIIAPDYEIYLPSDMQGVRRMAFGWSGNPSVRIEMASYIEGSPFWGGLPMLNH